MKIGPLSIMFHRTIRVATDKTSDLPPSLGYFDINKVSDYRETCPSYWEDNAVFIALHDKEAMWMSFGNTTPLAVLVGCGGINALNGEKLGTKLSTDSYLVTPPQPWLDGWKDQDGTVYQFVTTEYKKGEGVTVAEQLIGSESKTGGLGIAVFEAKDYSRFETKEKPEEYKIHSKSGHMLELCAIGADYDSKPLQAKEMGIGKGGKITQKIYPDPYGIEVWKDEPSAVMAIYLVDSKTFSEITGQPMPPLPVSFKEYYGKWFGIKDEEFKDIDGTDKFTGLKTAFLE